MLNLKTISVLDTTLRDGEQAPENAMTPQQKFRIAQRLSEIGVDYIETGFPASSTCDFEATKQIASNLPDVQIATFSRTLIADVELALQSGGKERKHTLQMVATGSDIHLKNKRNLSREQAITEMVKTIRFAKQTSDCRIAVGIEDASRGDWRYLEQMTTAAISAGAHQIILADTTGYATPSEFKELVCFIKKTAGSEVSIATHCHNDLGLAVANTLAGIEAGAQEVQVTLGGIGERAGNASLELVASALHFKPEIYRAKTNINLAGLYDVYQELCSTIHLSTPRNMPIFGDYAFSTAAGIHQQGILTDPNTYEFIKVDFFSRKRELLVSRHSGKAIIRYIFQKNNIPVCNELVEFLYKKFIDSRIETHCFSLQQLENEFQFYFQNFYPSLHPNSINP